ncbi:hypothetical protein B0H14DRAFT_3771634 [Mycena olivaceomarginata]|nr:hypothetical protein B0H14DRAFT_3771634 [Mycena olivaceomarginata]
MLFAFRSRVLSVALLCFSLSAHAASHYTPNDIHCPPESHPTFVHNSYTYNAPVDKFTNLTKSFFELKWYAGAIHVTAYAETMRFEGICSGKATYIDVITYLCSNDSIAVYDATYTAHMVSFQGLATSVGATVMAGDCPYVELMGYAVQKSQYVKACQEGVLIQQAFPAGGEVEVWDL